MRTDIKGLSLCVRRLRESISVPGVAVSVVLSVLGSQSFQQSVHDEIERIATWVSLNSRIGIENRGRGWASWILNMVR